MKPSEPSPTPASISFSGHNPKLKQHATVQVIISVSEDLVGRPPEQQVKLLRCHKRINTLTRDGGGRATWQSNHIAFRVISRKQFDELKAVMARARVQNVSLLADVVHLAEDYAPTTHSWVDKLRPLRPMIGIEPSGVGYSLVASILVDEQYWEIDRTSICYTCEDAEEVSDAQTVV